MLSAKKFLAISSLVIALNKLEIYIKMKNLFLRYLFLNILLMRYIFKDEWILFFNFNTINNPEASFSHL
jgi:hypothetical protein